MTGLLDAVDRLPGFEVVVPEIKLDRIIVIVFCQPEGHCLVLAIVAREDSGLEFPGRGGKGFITDNTESPVFDAPVANDLYGIAVTRDETVFVVIGDGRKLPDNTAVVLDPAIEGNAVITIRRFERPVCLIDGC